MTQCALCGAEVDRTIARHAGLANVGGTRVHQFCCPDWDIPACKRRMQKARIADEAYGAYMRLKTGNDFARTWEQVRDQFVVGHPSVLN